MRAICARYGNSGGYSETVVKVVKSWLAHNGKELKTSKIQSARDAPLKDERVPTQDELRRILSSSDRKARVASIVVAHSGLRLESSMTDEEFQAKVRLEQTVFIAL